MIEKAEVEREEDKFQETLRKSRGKH